MPRRRLLLVGALVVLVVTGVLAARQTPYGAEVSLGRWVYDWPSPLGAVVEVAMQFGARLAIVVVAAGLVVAGRARAGVAAAVAGVTAWLLATVLKAWLDRPRPALATLGRVPREATENFAWPSSHAAIAFALGTVLALTVARSRLCRALVAAALVLTCAGRLYVGAHWVLDVAGGAALGVVVAIAVVELVKP